MGIVVDGKWRDEELPAETGKAGEFQRADSRFRDCITADGSSGFKAEPGAIISTSPMAARGRTAR